MKTLDEIRKMIIDGDIAQAEAALRELLAKEPDNLQAKMLYGTCRQLLGDEETFRRIHGEIAPMMENKDAAGLQPGTVSLWKKYHALWMTLILGGLVLAGVGVATCYFGKNLFSKPTDEASIKDVNVDFPEQHEGRLYFEGRLYGGPRVEVLERVEVWENTGNY